MTAKVTFIGAGPGAADLITLRGARAIADADVLIWASSLVQEAVLERFPGATLLKCRLETGRTHQIRVHLLHIGHPIVGDRTYGGARAPGIARQALHAMRLEFIHPHSGERVAYVAPAPEDFERLLARLRGGTVVDAARSPRVAHHALPASQGLMRPRIGPRRAGPRRRPSRSRR